MQNRNIAPFRPVKKSLSLLSSFTGKTFFHHYCFSTTKRILSCRLCRQLARKKRRAISTHAHWHDMRTYIPHRTLGGLASARPMKEKAAHGKNLLKKDCAATMVSSDIQDKSLVLLSTILFVELCGN